MGETSELDRALSVAMEAGALLLSYFASDRLDTRSKGERDLVTAADTASEDLVVRRLRDAFPGDGVVGEEGSDRETTTGRCWYVDPLDATLNYARGVPVFCVSLSLFDGGRPILGVIYDPVREEAFSASSGRGAFLNGVPLRTRQTRRLEDAFVHMTIDFHRESLSAGLRDITEVAPLVMRTRNIGSAALALAYVAAGRFDAMIHRFAYPWDYGAGMLLVNEAGGHATSLTGAAYRVSDRAVLAAGTDAVHRGLAPLLAPSRVE